MLTSWTWKYLKTPMFTLATFSLSVVFSRGYKIYHNKIPLKQRNTCIQYPCYAAKSLQSCPTLCYPIDGSPPGFPVPGILQARTLEWVAISFSNAWKWKVKVKSLSHVWLFVTPRTAAYQAPLSMLFSRQEYWSGVPSPSLDYPRQHIRKQRHYFSDKDLYSQSYGFSSSHIEMWELDHKECLSPKNWCFWIVVLEKGLESPLDCKEIKPVNPKGDQSWIFIGRTEAEAPVLWPADAKSRLIGKDPDAGKDWRQEWMRWQRMTWRDDIIDSMNTSLSKFREMVKDREAFPG